MVIFRADVVGTESIADDFIDWADTTNNIAVGGENLQVAGVNHSCSAVDVGLITGILVTAVILVIAAVVVAVLCWKYSKKGRPVW